MKARYIIFGAVSTVVVVLVFALLWMQYGFVCNPAVSEHLHKHSNLFDEGFDGDFFIEDIGLPFGVTEMGIQECVDHVLSRSHG